MPFTVPSGLASFRVTVRCRTDHRVALRASSTNSHVVSLDKMGINRLWIRGLYVGDQKKSSDQMDAEADVEDHRRELGPFVVAAETTRMAMAFSDATDSENPIVFANDSFLKLTGFDRAELLGKSFNSLLAPGRQFA
jgi:PAS domain-containing protein